MEEGLPVRMLGKMNGFRSETWNGGRYIMADRHSAPYYQRRDGIDVVAQAKIGYVGPDANIAVLQRVRHGEGVSCAIVKIDCSIPSSVKPKFSLGFNVIDCELKPLAIDYDHVCDKDGRRRNFCSAIVCLRDGDTVQTVHWTGAAWQVSCKKGGIEFKKIPAEPVIADIHRGTCWSLASTGEAKIITAAMWMMKELIDYAGHDEDLDLMVRILDRAPADFMMQRDMLNMLQAAEPRLSKGSLAILKKRGIIYLSAKPTADVVKICDAVARREADRKRNERRARDHKAWLAKQGGKQAK